MMLTDDNDDDDGDGEEEDDDDRCLKSYPVAFNHVFFPPRGDSRRPSASFSLWTQSLTSAWRQPSAGWHETRQVMPSRGGVRTPTILPGGALAGVYRLRCMIMVMMGGTPFWLRWRGGQRGQQASLSLRRERCEGWF
jgi:hypothetical protein